MTVKQLEDFKQTFQHDGSLAILNGWYRRLSVDHMKFVALLSRVASHDTSFYNWARHTAFASWQRFKTNSVRAFAASCGMAIPDFDIMIRAYWLVCCTPDMSIQDAGNQMYERSSAELDVCDAEVERAQDYVVVTQQEVMKLQQAAEQTVSRELRDARAVYICVRCGGGCSHTPEEYPYKS